VATSLVTPPQAPSTSPLPTYTADTFLT
jgi:hypothetical protein